jgi:Co/Zn/Cd efflux system component
LILLAQAVIAQQLALGAAKNILDGVVLELVASEAPLRLVTAIDAGFSMSINAVWGIKWADPVAALCLTPFILREGWEAVSATH